ncbi:MAG: NAD+ synthase [Opitutaceae bacterium]|nr:NAD+ synthase [Opitutaceae bacterium]
MRIGLAQINTTVGDLAGNRRRIVGAYARLVGDGAELVVFPELVVTGYPPRDLLFKRRFVPDNEASLAEIAAQVGEVPAVIGFAERNTAADGRSVFNSAAVCRAGRVVAVARKSLLPTYDVFDEDRYFEPADRVTVVELGGRRIGITICEDIWTSPLVATRRRYAIDPVAQLRDERVDLHLNLSASPWHNGKGHLREQLVTQTAAATRTPLVYCNAVGGNDELIFDGRSMVASADGRLLAGLPAFREDCRVVDLTATGLAPAIDPTHRQPEMKDIHEALVLGLRDYAHKSGFRRALLGLSGGIDSAVTAVIAADALGAENVTGVSLPSVISSDHSRTDARVLAEHLGIQFHTVSIADVVAAAEGTLGPVFAGRPRDIAEENIQARARGLLLMAMSNKFGALLLTTGNKSELAVGYCTLYGDMCGGLAVISDLPKVKVYELAEYINREREIIPRSSIDKAPSAELRPDQTDQDSLPPYPVLDAILKAYVEEGHSSRDIIAQGFDEAVVRDVIRKVDLNEYKRKQAAPGLKLTPLAFGVGRRIPIVQRYVS